MDVQDEQIDTTNEGLAGVHGSHVVALRPLDVMTPERARRHAAWLVTMADALDPDPEHTFEEILAAVRST